MLFRRLGEKLKPALQCPKCKSKNIIGYGMIIGFGYIDPETMKVEEPSELTDWEPYSDKEDLELTCRDCDYEFDISD